VAASDADLILNLVQFAQLQGSPAYVLKEMILKLGAGLPTGGSRMISASVNGKSFSYQVDARLSVSDMMTAARKALNMIHGLSDAQISSLLNAPSSSFAVARF
jgi:hypothetical protein